LGFGFEFRSFLLLHRELSYGLTNRLSFFFYTFFPEPVFQLLLHRKGVVENWIFEEAFRVLKEINSTVAEIILLLDFRRVAFHALLEIDFRVILLLRVVFNFQIVPQDVDNLGP